MNKKIRFIISSVVALSMAFGCFPSVPRAEYENVYNAYAESLSDTAMQSYKFRAQLETPLEVKIYDMFEQMKNDGDFIRGTSKRELDAEQKIIKEYVNGDATLIQAFQNARDAFMCDSSDIFYVDWSKLSLRVTFGSNGEYHAFIGNGAYENFYCDNGFQDEKSILETISEIEKQADIIIAGAEKKTEETEKIRYVHDTLVEMADYLNPMDFSTFHGSNVCGILLHNEAWCEGYSRTFQYIMQRMGYDCVIVSGGAIPNSASNGDKLLVPDIEEHMWNYIRLSNGKWYAVDVTYDDPTVITADGRKSTLSDKYFLKGSDFFMANHVESGQFSQGGREFFYPVLSESDYGNEKGNELIFNVSYQDWGDDCSYTFMYPTYITSDGKILRGKEIVDSGYYLAWRPVFEDGEGNITTNQWTDSSRIAFQFDDNYIVGMVVKETAKNLVQIGYDFAIVSNAPDGGNTAPTAWLGNIDFVTFSDRVYLRDMYIDERTFSPRVVRRDPLCAAIEDEYRKVTIEYDSPLCLKDPDKNARLIVSTDTYGANFRVENFEWKNGEFKDQVGNTVDGCTVTFDFYPDSTFNYSGTTYSFRLDGLESSLNGTPPDTFDILWAVPMEKFFSLCTYRVPPSDITLCAKPKLIKNSFSPEMFTDPVGNLIANQANTMNISLIASRPSATEQDKINDALGMPNALEYSTYDLKLACSALKTCIDMSQNRGAHLTVCLPYPEGYDSRTLEGVAFEAYHFKKNADGSYTKEKLICNATEAGIFVIAEDFSPFTVVAVPEEEHISDGGKCISIISDSKISEVTAYDSDGNELSPELVCLKEGESVTFDFRPCENYSMEQFITNGTEKEIPERTDGIYSVTYTYEEIEENNLVIARFCADSVSEEEKAEGLSVAEPVSLDPTVCNYNSEPTMEVPESEPVKSPYREVSYEPVVMEISGEGITENPIVSTTTTTTETTSTTTTTETTSTTTTTETTSTTTTTTETTSTTTTTETTSTTTTTTETTSTTTTTETTSTTTTTETTSTTTTTETTTTTTTTETTSTTTTTKATTTTITTTTKTTETTPSATTTTNTTTTLPQTGYPKIYLFIPVVASLLTAFGVFIVIISERKKSGE